MSETMTSRERVEKLLNREVPDRVGVTETFWQDTVRSWTAQGYPKGAAPWEVFGHDVVRAGGVTQDAYPGRRSVIAETDAWRTVKDGNGATMRTWKNRPGVPEHIDFEIADADVWRRGYRDAVRTFNPDRVNLDRFTQVRETCRERDLFCCCLLYTSDAADE